LALTGTATVLLTEVPASLKLGPSALIMTHQPVSNKDRHAWGTRGPASDAKRCGGRARRVARRTLRRRVHQYRAAAAL